MPHPGQAIFWQEWSGTLLLLVGACMLGAGWLSEGGHLAPAGWFIITLLLAAGLLYLWRRKVGAPEGPGMELHGALLLLLPAWLVYRLGMEALPALVLLPAVVLAWIAAGHSRPVAGGALVVGLGMEEGLAASAGQPPLQNGSTLVFFLVLALAARYFPGSRLYRERLREMKLGRRREELEREQAREFGLESGAAELPEIRQEPDAAADPTGFSRQAMARVSASFELELEMLRQALVLTTVAIFWPSPDGSELRLRYLATARSDIDRGPYPAGSGMIGALHRQEEVELAPIAPTYPALPYYRDHKGVGAALALRIPEETDGPPAGGGPARRNGILCVDRESAEPWNERERQVLRLAARKLGLEVAGSRQLLNLDRERAAIHQFSLSLRELNSGLSLASVFAASCKALKAQAPLDLVAFSLLENEAHRLILADGPGLEELLGQSFPLSAGLVGQALRTGSVLPAEGRYLKPAPIFSSDRTFTEFKSLLIFPLRNEKGEALGALVTAARAPGIFNKIPRGMLELIATQVAIKIELAQAHEKLNLLATTDGLTGLANHRSFQDEFDIKLERARRSRTSLCLLLGDLDHFKLLNDTHGHPFGDLVLRQAARAMAETVRAVDLAARYGGEEFAIILENCDATGGLLLAERIREKITQLQPVCQGVAVPVSISLGLVVFPDDGEAKDLLISRADQALYRAKLRGRNRTVIWLASDE
jgi:diguanylate cyclase (GGDEF)-like protein